MVTIYDSIHVRSEYVIEQLVGHRWVLLRTLPTQAGINEAQDQLRMDRAQHPNRTFRLVRDDITRTRTHIDPCSVEDA